MAIHIKNLKVRPRKNVTQNMCGTQLAAMLGCWAATDDLGSTGLCEDSAKALFQCMRTTPLPKKTHRPTINYHLARLGKTIQ
ncbi:37S ribosomal protein mrp10, mitochondrial [Hypsizygus marmoreus]|uniref:37S ribosomal protein mrp10, mitochondrial n=1 Tax=Hypsizygus marmoreus TaxID=39966 RepID=A0A369JVB6_HYPMA|nr:37S ribosomal protein mrp10, mitochondrial [Hypsizygus marmoreus]